MRFTPSLFLCVITSILLLAGCASTPQERISQNQKAFESYPSDVQRKISAGQVDVGFLPEMVTLALGKPGKIYNRADAHGESEVWVYSKSKPQFSFGVGVGSSSGGYHGGTSTGVGVSTTTAPDDGEYMRVVFQGGKVTSIEKTTST
jgi:outer membrane lipoprotein-sorting protein